MPCPNNQSSEAGYYTVTATRFVINIQEFWCKQFMGSPTATRSLDQKKRGRQRQHRTLQVHQLIPPLMMRCHFFFNKQNVVPYNDHCIGRGCVHFSAPAGPWAASFSLQNAMCDGSKCAVFRSLFLSLWGYWVWRCQRSRNSLSFVLFPSSSDRCFPSSLLCKLELRCSKGSLLPSCVYWASGRQKRGDIQTLSFTRCLVVF